MNKGDKYYMEITTWLLENHNEVYDEWNEFHYKIIEEKRLTDIEKEKEEIERKKPQLLELANWCEVNKEWLESLEHTKQRLAVLHIIYLNFMLLVILKMEGE